MIYTKKVSIKGVEMFYAGNKLCSKRSIPQIVLENIKVGEPYEYQRQEVKQAGKECIFCGEFAKFSRFINLRSIALCEEHVYSKSTGQIAQQIREKTHA